MSGTFASLYNTYLVDLLLHAKARDAAGDFRRKLREAGHKAIEPDSLAYIQCAARSIAGGEFVSNRQGDVTAVLEECAAFEVLPGVRLGDFANAYKNENASHHSSIADARTYAYVLAVLAKTFDEVNGDDADPLAKCVIQVLDRQLGSHGEASDAGIDGILDDDIATLLRLAGSAHATAQDLLEKTKDDAAAAAAAASASDEPTASTSSESAAPLEDLFKSLKSSKIMDMASEIHKEINLSGTEDPMELLSFDKLSDSNSVLGSIVTKVGSKIQSKLASGELKHDELIGEAMGFLKAFEGSAGGGNNNKNSNPLAGIMSALGGAQGGNLMADVMKMAQGLGAGGGGGGAGAANRGNGRASLSERREKLRAKAMAAKKD